MWDRVYWPGWAVLYSISCTNPPSQFYNELGFISLNALSCPFLIVTLTGGVATAWWDPQLCSGGRQWSMLTILPSFLSESLALQAWLLLHREAVLCVFSPRVSWWRPGLEQGGSRCAGSSCGACWSCVCFCCWALPQGSGDRSEQPWEMSLWALHFWQQCHSAVWEFPLLNLWTGKGVYYLHEWDRVLRGLPAPCPEPPRWPGLLICSRGQPQAFKKEWDFWLDTHCGCGCKPYRKTCLLVGTLALTVRALVLVFTFHSPMETVSFLNSCIVTLVSSFLFFISVRKAIQAQLINYLLSPGKNYLSKDTSVPEVRGEDLQEADRSLGFFL